MVLFGGLESGEPAPVRPIVKWESSMKPVSQRVHVFSALKSRLGWPFKDVLEAKADWPFGSLMKPLVKPLSKNKTEVFTVLVKVLILFFEKIDVLKPCLRLLLKLSLRLSLEPSLKTSFLEFLKGLNRVLRYS